MNEDSRNYNEEAMAFYPLAIALALRYYRARALFRWYSREDVQQEALLALLEAVRQCDRARPIHEKVGFYKRRIVWQLSRLAKSGGLVRVPPGACQSSAGAARSEYARKVNTTIFESYDEARPPTWSREQSSPEDQAAAHELARLINRLPERQRRVLVSRYGLDDGHERTLAEVGEVLGVSRQCAHGHEQLALATLRELMGVAVPPSGGDVPLSRAAVCPQVRRHPLPL
jgi:RNA polymerase sigma factor (sigma-70 family)